LEKNQLDASCDQDSGPQIVSSINFAVGMFVPHSGHCIILVYGWSAIEGTFVLIAGVGYGSLTEAVEPEKPPLSPKFI
jgi:hypothetical protein